MDGLIGADKDLLLAINGMHTPFWDAVFYWISNRFVWIPVYLLVLFLLYRRYGLRTTLWILGFTGLIILIADQAASGFLKPLVGRPRPCHDPEIGEQVYRVFGKCGGPYGFVSSHAANFFGLATWLSFLFRPSRRAAVLCFFCAFLVGFSRVYLGVHYPGDVVAGGLLGIMSAILVIFLIRRLSSTLKLSRIP